MLMARAGVSERIQWYFILRSKLTPGFEAVSHSTADYNVVISDIIATSHEPVMTRCKRNQALD
jgi:hypothetical protein